MHMILLDRPEGRLRQLHKVNMGSDETHECAEVGKQAEWGKQHTVDGINCYGNSCPKNANFVISTIAMAMRKSLACL